MYKRKPVGLEFQMNVYTPSGSRAKQRGTRTQERRGTRYASLQEILNEAEIHAQRTLSKSQPQRQSHGGPQLTSAEPTPHQGRARGSTYSL